MRSVVILCDSWSSLCTAIKVLYFISLLMPWTLGLLDKVVEEIGEEYVVQVVTNNASTLKSARKMVMRKRKQFYCTSCSAYYINLMPEDTAKRRV